MNTTLLPMRRVAGSLALAGLALIAGQAGAHDVYLCAKTLDLAVPGGGTVPMWAFAPDNAAGDCSQPATVPGPAIEVPAGDTTLNVYLKNTLTTPVSLVINGQAMPAATGAEPVWTDGTTGARNPTASPPQRVRSFVHETAPGLVGTYTFNGIKPGTYLYQSGSHPQVQVQMGLYGALIQDAVAASGDTLAQAYPDVTYSRAVTLLYSEVDPALHAAVSSGAYDPTVNSTLNYLPKYFLINGKAFASGAPALAILTAGQKTLLRFLNAGLQTHVPIIAGTTLGMIAEDGNPYPWPANPRQQYSVFLPAAKTVDAIFTPQLRGDGAGNRYAVYDRRLSLTNGATQNGGMLAFLNVATGTGAPVIDSLPVTMATQGVPYSYTVSATDDGDAALAYSLDIYPAGMSIDAATGAIAWTPTVAQAGTQAVTARVTDTLGLFDTQSFNIAVDNQNDPPVAANDVFTMIVNSTRNVLAPGVLANDSDPDVGDTMTAVNFSTPGNGTLTANGNGGFDFTATTTGNKTFTYQAQDSLGVLSAPATVTMKVIANRKPIAVDDTYDAVVRTGRPWTYTNPVLPVLANDSDPDTALDPSNVIVDVRVVVKPNKGGKATVRSDGTISYMPMLSFRGTEAFQYQVKDNLGKWSNRATVLVNVQ